MSRKFNLELCKVLGLDPKLLSEFSVTCVAGKPTEVRTVSFLLKPGADVETITRSFELKERSDAMSLTDPRVRLHSMQDEVGESFTRSSQN